MRGEGRVVAAVCHCCTDSPSSYYYYHHRSAGFKASEASELEYGFRKEAPAHWLHHGGRGIDECHLLPKGFDHSFICLGNYQNGN